MRDRLSLSKIDFEDYEFILAELLKLAQMSFSEVKAHYQAHDEDRLHFVPRPEGGSLPFTRAGDERFWRIAERGCGTLGSEGKKHRLAGVVQELKAELMRRYLADPAGITDENAHEIFQHVIQSLAQSHKELEHFIPCAVVSNSQLRRLCIGPAEFLVMEDFLAQNEDALRNGILPKITPFFSQFKWVARVRVAASDDGISREKARAVVRNALNLLKLFLGAEYAQGVRDGYSAGEPQHVTMLIRDIDRFQAPSRWKMQDAAVAEGWFSSLSNLPAWRIAEGVIAIHASTWDHLCESRQRFLDALSWHGDAVAETEPRSRIIKFWASIERIVSRHVTRRASMLAINGRNLPDQMRKEVERLYNIRSSIIHGSLARPRATIYRDALKTEELSRAVLVHYLYLLHKLGENATRADIESEFETLGRFARPEATCATTAVG